MSDSVKPNRLWSPGEGTISRHLTCQKEIGDLEPSTFGKKITPSELML
jgi:hypothetical protein